MGFQDTGDVREIPQRCGFPTSQLQSGLPLLARLHHLRESPASLAGEHDVLYLGRDQLQTELADWGLRGFRQTSGNVQPLLDQIVHADGANHRARRYLHC